MLAGFGRNGAFPCCRDFVHNSYQELKKANPKLPILIRECSGIQARMIARYGEPTKSLCCICL